MCLRGERVSLFFYYRNKRDLRVKTHRPVCCDTLFEILDLVRGEVR